MHSTVQVERPWAPSPAGRTAPAKQPTKSRSAARATRPRPGRLAGRSRLARCHAAVSDRRNCAGYPPTAARASSRPLPRPSTRRERAGRLPNLGA
jgi:hypothetical protein